MRKQQRKFAAAVQTLIAFILSFYLSGCDGVNVKMWLLSWLVIGPLMFQLIMVIRPQWFPAWMTDYYRASSLLFGIGLIFPFWLVGLGAMKVFV